MRNAEVITAWMNGQNGVNGRRSLRTDGTMLWSYRLCIGATSKEGYKIVFLYQSPRHFRSMTTSHHVAQALRRAHVGVTPFIGWRPYDANTWARVDSPVSGTLYRELEHARN